MNSKELKIDSSIPNFSITLDSIRNLNTSTSNQWSIYRKANPIKVKKDSLKTKINFERMQEIQQSPKISCVSKALTGSNSITEGPKIKYIKKLKSQVQELKSKKQPKKTKTIDYGLVKSSSEFAIFSTCSESSSLIIKNQSNTNTQRPKDMYTRGQNFLVIKKNNQNKKIQKLEEETFKVCTFSPKLIKSSTNRNKKSNKTLEQSKQIEFYRSLSPYNRKMLPVVDCNLGNLAIRFSNLPVWLNNI